MTLGELNKPLTVSDMLSLIGGLGPNDKVIFAIYPMGKMQCIEISAGGQSIYVFRAVE